MNTRRWGSLRIIDVTSTQLIVHNFVYFPQRIYHNLSLVAQMVKRLSTMLETWVRSLGWEDPLEREMAIHSRTIAWKIPWTEEPGRLQSMGSQRVRHDWATSFSLFFILSFAYWLVCFFVLVREIHTKVLWHCYLVHFQSLSVFATQANSRH